MQRVLEVKSTSERISSIFTFNVKTVFFCSSISPYLNNEQITVLMYADDLIILSLSHEGLQKCLDELNRYCKEWSLKANSEKTKCAKFLKVGRLYNKSFNIGNTPLENVKEFTRLGITINGAGSFQPSMKDLSDKQIEPFFL